MYRPPCPAACRRWCPRRCRRGRPDRRFGSGSRRCRSREFPVRLGPLPWPTRMVDAGPGEDVVRVLLADPVDDREDFDVSENARDLTTFFWWISLSGSRRAGCVGVAQDALEDLPGGAHGQFVDERVTRRASVLGQLGGGQVPQRRFEVRDWPGVRGGDDDRASDLEVFVVGDPDHGDGVEPGCSASAASISAG